MFQVLFQRSRDAYVQVLSPSVIRFSVLFCDWSIWHRGYGMPLSRLFHLNPYLARQPPRINVSDLPLTERRWCFLFLTSHPAIRRYPRRRQCYLSKPPMFTRYSVTAYCDFQKQHLTRQKMHLTRAGQPTLVSTVSLIEGLEDIYWHKWPTNGIQPYLKISTISMREEYPLLSFQQQSAKDKTTVSRTFNMLTGVVLSNAASCHDSEATSKGKPVKTVTDVSRIRRYVL